LSALSKLMFRQEMPRVYELKDLSDDSSARFHDFDSKLGEGTVRRKTWLAREHEFQRLDEAAWQFLKQEAQPYLTVNDTKGRGWQQFMDILNQVRAYNHLVDLGCSGVQFIPTKTGQQTPDLEGELYGRKVLCEVKTINISDKEVLERGKNEVRGSTNKLEDLFLKKLISTLEKARGQMKAYNDQKHVRHIAFVVPNFDDRMGEYNGDYYLQIDQYLVDNPYSDIEIVFYNESIFECQVSMTSATLINRFPYPILSL